VASLVFKTSGPPNAGGGFDSHPLPPPSRLSLRISWPGVVALAIEPLRRMAYSWHRTIGGVDRRTLSVVVVYERSSESALPPSGPQPFGASILRKKDRHTVLCGAANVRWKGAEGVDGRPANRANERVTPGAA
jgi:hypothetical protein